MIIANILDKNVCLLPHTKYQIFFSNIFYDWVTRQSNNLMKLTRNTLRTRPICTFLFSIIILQPVTKEFYFDEVVNTVQHSINYFHHNHDFLSFIQIYKFTNYFWTSVDSESFLIPLLLCNIIS